jgi:hypothetical protein
MFTRLSIAAILILSACSSDDAGDGGVVFDAGPNDNVDADTRSGETFTATWGPYDVPAGTEDTRCFVTRLTNDRQIRVGEITNVLGDASHHFIVYRIASGDVSTEPYPCQPFADTLNPANGAPLMVTQKAEETLALPDGVAFTLEPNQLIRLELHFINTTEAVQSVTATSTFRTMAIDDFEFEADFLFVGNPDIDLAPGEVATVGPSFLPLDPDLAGSKIFGITGHTHQYGTDVKVEIGAPGSEVMIYDVPSFNWDEPDTVMLEPAVDVAADTGFKFSCDFNNTSGQQVGFGEGVDDEMCFFWAYYYPSKGARVCFHTDQQGGLDLCCPSDNVICAFLEDYLDQL